MSTPPPFPDLAVLDAAITECRACPRLVAWREEVARTKRAAYRHEEYWGRPAPGFGSTEPSVLIVGLAPAAHGANRTGRVFTGDRSGDWLFASLHRVGLASQAESIGRDDGMELYGARVLSAVRCAPPENKPTPEERDTCASWLDAELSLVLPTTRVVVTLGAFGWGATLAALARAGASVPTPRPRFGHGAEVPLPMPGREDLLLLGCFHPSPLNTSTGRLTASMLDDVLGRAARLTR